MVTQVSFDTLSQISGGLPGTAPRVFSATSDQLLSVLLTPGAVADLYAAKKIKARDIIYINYDMDGTPGQGCFMVNAASSGSLVLQQKSAANGLTAFAGGGQTDATQLYADINRVTTVATAADSVKLPKAYAGMEICVINAAAANAMAVFPATGEIINALSANASLSVVANKALKFICAVDGTWNSILTA